MIRLSVLGLCLVSLAASACQSSAPAEPLRSPDEAAPATTAALNKAARETEGRADADPTSQSRVLAYVNGEVVTYRDVLLRIKPQLAVLENPEDRERLEHSELLSILQDRIIYRAAREAMVDATREEVDKERAARVAELERNGFTLDAFLNERGMTRREFDETILRRGIVIRKFLYAAIGRNADPRVRVRAMTDPSVCPADLVKYYERHPERFHEPALARCRKLEVMTDFLLPDREVAVAQARGKAAGYHARLRSGEDFVPLFREANRGSADADTRDGLLEIQRGGKEADWIEEFAFTSPRGTVSDVIQKGATFYVLRAEGAQEERTVPFSECQELIAASLMEAKRQMAVYEVELALIEESSIQPDTLRVKLRDSLRAARLQLMNEVGL